MKLRPYNINLESGEKCCATFFLILLDKNNYRKIINNSVM